MKALWMRAAAIVLAAALVACDKDPSGTAGVDRVELDADEVEMVAGDSVEVTAVALDAMGVVVAEPILWQTFSPAVATLRVSGGKAVVRAVAAGTAVIEAEAGGRTARLDVTVAPRPVVASVMITPATVVLQPGEAVTVMAHATTASGAPVAGRTVTWSTTGPVATVTANPDGSATVTGVAAGEVVLKAAVDGETGEAMVHVVEDLPPAQAVATIVIAPDGFSLPIDHETSLQAIAKAADGTILPDVAFTWSVSVDSVAAVSPIGASPFASFRAVKPGVTEVRATAGNITGTALVTVTAATPATEQPYYLVFPMPHRGVWSGLNITLAEHLYGVGASGTIQNPVVTWSADDAAIATVDADGTVHGVSPGTTRIWAQSGDVRASIAVTVFDFPGNPSTWDVTFDWWDGHWRISPVFGRETWTDDAGTSQDVALYVTGGSLTLSDDGQYERVLRVQGWAHVGDSARLVVDREDVDHGTWTILVGSANGYGMHSTVTPGHAFEVHQAFNAGHMVMVAELGDATETSYMLRLRQ